jgi:hypothetical protein
MGRRFQVSYREFTIPRVDSMNYIGVNVIDPDPLSLQSDQLASLGDRVFTAAASKRSFASAYKGST